MNGIEFNSIDRFRQFKKEIRGSKDHLIVGLDIASASTTAFSETQRPHAAQGADR